jgi:hydroxyethylthiazole kinase
MSHAPEEVAEMAQIASALVLNIGTLTPDFIGAMKIALVSANQKGIPVILDVCGAGATKFRDCSCLELLEAGKIDIIKGNASEIARISGANVQTRGVDSTDVGADLVALARELARARDTVVVITGQVDILAQGDKICLVKNGHPMMTNVVGTGCMAASVIATFAAVQPDLLLLAAAAGLSCYEVAAELAVEKCAGPASFKERLFDSFFHLDRETCNRMQKLEFLGA